MDTVLKETKYLKKSVAYREVHNEILQMTKFLKQDNLTLVPTDKSKRLCVTGKDTYINNTASLLQDIQLYKPRQVSKSKQIENQANKLIKSSFKNILGKSDLERLLVSGSAPAAFKTFIKDHKKLTNGAYPMRPIASARNTPTEKVDWICSKILNNLVTFVSAHLKSSEELITNLQNLQNLSNLDKFISLDVISLYPSVPLDLALEVVGNFARKYWSRIDNLGLDVGDFERCLKFVMYNYEIIFNGNVYLQVSGVPMGTHFAPPFAVIFMDHIENKALKNLENENIKPTIFKRYIDDIIIGPFPDSLDLFDKILNAFNQVNDNIKFTIEIPTKALNFLDLTIWIEDHVVKHKYYTKEVRSVNCLNKGSWVPGQVKKNFINSYINTATQRCSEKSDKQEAVERKN